ncbi:MAG: hypothetical protein ACPG7F_00280 [Aggregatilineales bacterium]
MKKAYSVIKVSPHVYVNSSSHYSFEIVLDWRGSRRSGWYDPMHHDLVMKHSGRWKWNSSIVRKYPKYLREDIAAAVHELFTSGDAQFYEYDRDGSKRYDNLRYHHDESFNACLEWITQDIIGDDYET